MTKILESTVEGKYLLFRGKPLVREGNQICYGEYAGRNTSCI